MDIHIYYAGRNKPDGYQGKQCLETSWASMGRLTRWVEFYTGNFLESPLEFGARGISLCLTKKYHNARDWLSAKNWRNLLSIYWSSQPGQEARSRCPWSVWGQVGAISWFIFAVFDWSQLSGGNFPRHSRFRSSSSRGCLGNFSWNSSKTLENSRNGDGMIRST